MTHDPEAEARAQTREYLKTKATDLPADVIRERVTQALAAFERFAANVSAEQARRRAWDEEWAIQEIVDHLVETYRPGVDELRCVLAGRRPPGEPIPASLQSKAPMLRPWAWLLRELRTIHADVGAMLEDVPPDFETSARAPVVMVINTPRADGTLRPLHWIEDFDWKAYAIISWRLHAIDHLNQAKKVLAALK
jgi:hypothetical protein